MFLVLDEFARQSGGIDSVDIEVDFALASFLVEAFAHFENDGIFLILIIVVAIVVIVVVVVTIIVVVVVVLIVVIPIILGGLHAQSAFVNNDALIVGVAVIITAVVVLFLVVVKLRGVLVDFKLSAFEDSSIWWPLLLFWLCCPARQTGCRYRC